ncbi:uncharacterized protein BKCO1_4000192 [Diplodia corticola]|uniref:Uncharacterized protein n=1 Tax=Diplodia corticola TaxID=236234 RepID=A0A1J9REU0_9PEZI|nr:uncharacterized protein BKCO1_4000192 [Diplodia corticola]OJD38602.1 hypothetical protein BKCO1_4000192 [Diplodia corticola]
MERQNEQSSPQSWALTDSLREALDTRVKSFLETLDSSKTMNAWGATPRRDSILSESSAAAEERAKTDYEATSTSTAEDLALDADHSLDAQIMLAETAIPKSAANAEAEQDKMPRAHSCTIDGACLRDLWLRGMVTVAGTALLLLF